jgi:hypothetical protein
MEASDSSSLLISDPVDIAAVLVAFKHGRSLACGVCGARVKCVMSDDESFFRILFCMRNTKHFDWRRVRDVRSITAAQHQEFVEGFEEECRKKEGA